MLLLRGGSRPGLGRNVAQSGGLSKLSGAGKFFFFFFFLTDIYSLQYIYWMLFEFLKKEVFLFVSGTCFFFFFFFFFPGGVLEAWHLGMCKMARSGSPTFRSQGS